MTTNQSTLPATRKPVGGRKITPRHRLAEKFAREFIPREDFDRFRSVHILKRIGSKLPGKDGAKWNRQLIDHLELLVSMTQERDWVDGTPVVWMSVAETASRLGISASQVNYNENQLLQLGAITWTDSANHKRFGRRNERGRIIFAYGINLGPLGRLQKYLEDMEDLIDQERQERKTAKMAFAALRRHIRGIFSCPEKWQINLSAAEADFNALIEEMRIREHTRSDMIRMWIDQLEGFVSRLDEAFIEAEHDEPVDNWQNSAKKPSNLGPRDHADTAPGSYEHDAHRIQDQISSMKYNTSSDDAAVNAVQHLSVPPEPYPHRKSDAGEQTEMTEAVEQSECHEGGCGSEGGKLDPVSNPRHMNWCDTIDLDHLMRKLPFDLRSRFPEHPGWRDLIAIAPNIASDLGIHSSAWHEACRVLGYDGAALVLLIVAVKHSRGSVTSPGGYLRGMIRKARHGALDLWPSIFGIQTVAAWN